MERKVVKKRGGGRPNRGGGRHNKRGRGNPRPSGPCTAARKGGAELYDEDDMFAFDEIEEKETRPHAQHRQAHLTGMPTQHGRGNGSARPRMRYVYNTC